MSHIEFITYDRRWHHLFWILKQSFKRHVWKFFKKFENAVSAIQNVIIMPSLLSLRHEMDKNRSQCRPRGETTTWKRRGWSLEIRRSIWVWLMLYFTPKVKEKYFPPLIIDVSWWSSAKKWDLCSTSHEHRTKKKSESPTLIEPIWPPVHPSDALTTELRWTCDELGHIQGLCFTCVLCTVRISDFDMY